MMLVGSTYRDTLMQCLAAVRRVFARAWSFDFNASPSSASLLYGGGIGVNLREDERGQT